MEVSGINPSAFTPPAKSRALHKAAAWFARPILFPQADFFSKSGLGLDPERVKSAMADLAAIGGESVVFKTAHGEKLGGMVFKASKFWTLLLDRFELIDTPREGRVLVSRQGRFEEIGGSGYSIRLTVDEDWGFADLLKRCGFSVEDQAEIPGVEGVRGLVIRFPMPDGPATKVDPKNSSHPTVFLLEGNAGLYTFYREDIALYLQQGMDVVTFNYRGSGESGGTPNGGRLFKDAETVYQYVSKEMGVEDKDLLLYGHCIGGAAAANLAMNHPDAHLILDRTWSSLEKVVSNRFGWLKKPAEALLPHLFDFNNVSKVAEREGSTLFIASTSDDVIGNGHVEEMNQKEHEAIETDRGHGGSWVREEQTASVVAMFLENRGLGRLYA